jgi:hypothetical protein
MKMAVGQIGTRYGEKDRAEAMIEDIDNMAKQRSGISIFHVLTLLSILGSIALFMSGRKMEAIFVGLWPPTFQALKSAAENR